MFHWRMGYSLYRVLSKNLSARAENRRYLAISGNIRKDAAFHQPVQIP